MPPPCFTGEMFCLCLMVPNKHVPVVLVCRSNSPILVSPSSTWPTVSPSSGDLMPHEAFSGEETSPHLLKADSLFNQKSIHLRVVVGVLVASLTGLILVGPLGCICTCNLLIWCNFQFSSITFISAGGDSLCSLTPSPLPFEKKLYCDLK